MEEELAFALIFSAVVALTLPFFRLSSNKSKKDSEKSFRFLLINDVYKPKKLAQLARSLEKYRSEVTNCKFIVAGDFLGGSTFASKSQGKSIIDILNALNADYLLLGNHEFDYGSDVTREVMPRSTAEWFGSNCRNVDGSLFPYVLDTKILQVDSKRIGLFGIITQNTPYLSMPGENVVFENYLEHAKRCVAHLREQSDFIVALTHVSIAHDKELSNLSIDLILGGHDHTPFHVEQNGTTILKCGQDAELLGVVDVDLDSGKVENVQMISTLNEPKDPKINEIISQWRLKFAEEGDERELCVIRDCSISTMTAELRSKETNFGTIVADALRHYILTEHSTALASPNIPLIGIINGGFIRANETYDVGERLTVFDVKEELPFPRSPIMFEMTGALLFEALEAMLVKLPSKTGAFPHFSVGVKATYRYEAPRIQSFQINEVELKPEDPIYVVISDAYYIKACDGVETYRQKGKIKAHPTGILIREVVANYLSKLDSISGELPGRFLKVAA